MACQRPDTSQSAGSSPSFGESHPRAAGSRVMHRDKGPHRVGVRLARRSPDPPRGSAWPRLRLHGLISLSFAGDPQGPCKDESAFHASYLPDPRDIAAVKHGNGAASPPHCPSGAPPAESSQPILVLAGPRRGRAVDDARRRGGAEPSGPPEPGDTWTFVVSAVGSSVLVVRWPRRTATPAWVQRRARRLPRRLRSTGSGGTSAPAGEYTSRNPGMPRAPPWPWHCIPFGTSR